MERELSNSVNMIRATLTFCTNNPTPTSGIPAFATAKTNATNKLVLIDGLNQIAGLTSTGVTTDTNQIRQTMCDISFKVGSALSAYAASVNNNTLRDNVTFSRTAYKEFKKDEVDDICQTVHDEGDTNIAAAAAFGYDATDITDLQTAIDLYRTSAQNPRQAIISKGQAVSGIRNLVRDIINNIFVKQMDKMVDTLLLTEPNFHKGYRLSRETINIGVTHAKVRGSVRDINTAPLVGASFKIFIAGTSQLVAQTVTTVTGSFSISPVAAGDYDFVWSFPGYQTVTQLNIHVAAGKELQRKIVLQAGSTGTVTIVRDSDVPAAAILSISLAGINGTDASTVHGVVTGSLRFFAAATPDGVLGASTEFYDATDTTFDKTLTQFGALIGHSEFKPYVRVQNIGSALAHYSLTFNNLD